MTIKSHKAPGKVKPRNVHGAFNHAFAPLSRWVVSVLAPMLRRYPHVCWNSHEVYDQVRKIIVLPDDVLLRLDVSEFHVGRAL